MMITKKFTSKTVLIIFLSLFFVFLSLLLSLFLGAQKINFSEIFLTGSNFSKTILFRLRLPRSLLVLLTGLLLGGSGAVFQLFFRNPLAEPSVMGITSGATLGAVIASVGLSGIAVKSFFSTGIINLAAFAAALIAGLFITFISFFYSKNNSSVMLLLCGTALGTLYSSISSAILFTNSKELWGIFSWILGSFNGRGWKELQIIILPAVLCFIIMILICPKLDLLSGGENSALSLGLDVKKLRSLVLICGSLGISSAVCAGGTISFIGLIAPHLARKIAGPKSKNLLPTSMLFGAILLLLSDTLARILIAPSELPAGIITSILGVPFFIALCLGKK